MKDRELLDEFVRVARTEGGVRILVREIRWEGPHTPVSTWVIARTLPATASETEVENSVVRILEDGDYFQVCNECGSRKPLGWMEGGGICQGCAEVNHGVVH